MPSTGVGQAWVHHARRQDIDASILQVAKQSMSKAAAPPVDGSALIKQRQAATASARCRLAELSQQERRQLGLEFDQMMRKREGELTYMLNFMADGKVADSCFGGDSTSPELGF
jgi:hypothetical protein